MKKTVTLPDGTVEVFEGTAEEIAEMERRIRENAKPGAKSRKGVLLEDFDWEPWDRFFDRFDEMMRKMERVPEPIMPWYPVTPMYPSPLLPSPLHAPDPGWPIPYPIWCGTIGINSNGINTLSCSKCGPNVCSCFTRGFNTPYEYETTVSRPIVS